MRKVDRSDDKRKRDENNEKDYKTYVRHIDQRFVSALHGTKAAEWKPNLTSGG